MSATLLSGNDAAAALLETLKPLVREFDPKLVIVQVGDNQASNSYIKKKLQSCASIGMRHEHLKLPADIDFETLINEVHRLNEDEDVTGFIVQLPLSEHLQDRVPELLKEIEPMKDVDGFTAYNLGKTFLSTEFEHLPPATPAGIVVLLEHYSIGVAGKHVVIVGRSNIVGKPLAMMLINRGATVTVCNSKTPDFASVTRQGDILVSAAGKANLIMGDMVKKGAVVIDVGTNRNERGACGDVDFEAVKEIASAITPVPGGVGPMTVASLLRNCVRAASRLKERNLR